ncbi:hypothetical protein [Neisseria sp. 83E34]|uniref:hypothetical protein n=1 Tax=Neisseria sp. 83E34 TaxID=1692264 RepID=UPI0012E26A87|nr:hypothetical protein [Neisseria sp. 83E34]
MPENFVMSFGDILFFGMIVIMTLFSLSLRKSSDPAPRVFSLMGLMMALISIVLWVLKKEQLI